MVLTLPLTELKEETKTTEVVNLKQIEESSVAQLEKLVL